MIFGLFKYVYTDSWAPTLNTDMQPYMAMKRRLSLKFIFFKLYGLGRLYDFWALQICPYKFLAPTLNTEMHPYMAM